MAFSSNTFPAWRYATFFKVVLAHVFAKAHKFEVFNAVIQFVAILVVNYLVSIKDAAKMLGHYKSVFADIAARVSHRMVWLMNLAVAGRGDLNAASPVRIQLTGSAVEVTSQARSWIAAKASFLDYRTGSPYFGRFTATAFADPGRCLIGRGNVQSPGCTDTGIVASHKSWLIVSSAFRSIWNFRSTTAFAIPHIRYFTTV